MTQQRRPFIPLVAGAGLLAAAVGGYMWLNAPKAASPSGGTAAQRDAASAPAASASAPRAVGVEVAKVERATLQDDAQAVGSLRSKQNVVIRPEVAGRIAALGFEDGGAVRKGQLLVQLDDVLQRAEVQQSQAQVSIAQANLQRNKELVAQNFVAQRVLDESSAAVQVAQAQLSLSCARLQRMRIHAPFAGTVGIRSAHVGDYVKDGADLVNLEDLSSLWVDFRLPERFQNKLKRGQSVELQMDGFPNRAFKAQVAAIDPAIDANARAISVRAALPNTAGEPMAARGVGPAAAGASAPISASKPAPVSKSGAPARRAAPAALASSEFVQAESAELRVCKPLVASADAVAPAASAGRAGVNARTAPAARAPAAVGGAGRAGSPAAGPLRPGMFARVTTVFGQRERTLIVPEEALVPQGGKQFVFKLVSPSVFPASVTAALGPDVTTVSQRVEVKVGVRRPGKVEVEAAGAVALAEADSVVVAGQQRLQRDATPVRVVDLSRPTGPPAGAASGTASAAALAPASAPAAGATAPTVKN